MSTLKDDLLELRRLKGEAEEAGRAKKKADADFKRKQARVLERMDAEEIESLRADGTLFTPTETIYGQVNDRSKFVAWALENDPELVEHQERGELINALARRLLDDGEPFPPGLTFRTKQYVSHRGGKDD